MLLCTLSFLNNNSDPVTRHISNEDLALTNNYWDAYIAGMTPIKWGLTKPYGGMVQVTVGDMDLLPTVFDNQGTETGDTWPPPYTMGVLIEYGDLDDGVSDKITLFEGTAHLQDIDRGSIVYDLFAQQPTFTVRSMKVEETLESLFEKFVDMWDPDYTLDATYAASTSPDVDMTSPDTDMLLIDVLADICEYHGHFFYIDHDNSKVHLVEMDTSNGTAGDLTEFDFLPSRYVHPAPIRKIIVGDSYALGDYAHGIEVPMDNVCIPDAFIRAGNNDGNDEAWIVHNGTANTSGTNTFIPYDKNRLYKVSFRYRKAAGTHSIYGGLTCMLNLTTKNNLSGADLFTSQHYMFVNSNAPDNEWHNVTGYITGEASPGTDNRDVDGTTIAGAITARTNTTYIRPTLIMNYDNDPGITDIAYVAIDEVDTDGAVVENLYKYEANYFNSDEWTNVGGIDNINSSAQDAIDSIKSIAEKPVVELRLPITSENQFNMGQELSWVDESPHQPIDVTIKIREITYDFVEDEMIIVGEGTLTEVA